MINKKPEAITWANDDEFAASQSYGRDQARFALISSTFSTVKLVLFMSFGVYPLVWNAAVALANTHLALDSSYQISISLIYYFIDSLIDTCFSLPLSLYSTFVLEARHGFNRSTLITFFTDLLKSMMLSVLIGFPIIALLLFIIDYFSPNFVVYCWLLVLFIQLTGAFIYPTLIQPLFNTVKPLEQGELRSEIEKLAAELEFPAKKLFVIDGSRRSAHSNAYLYGKSGSFYSFFLSFVYLPSDLFCFVFPGFCGNKRIVLFDTLINQVNRDEICAILLHEIGHWANNHTLQMLIVAQIQTFALFFLFGKCVSTVQIYRDFGFSSEPTFIGLMLFQLLYSPVQHVLDFLSNVITRKFEYQADEFAVKWNRGPILRSALIKLQKENKSTMIPDPLYSAYHHSHPTVFHRLLAMDKKISQLSKKSK
jgi:STE24 endopeptidase